MMSAGLELGSHAPDCWSHLLRCCLYLAELERKFFSASQPLVSFGFPSSQGPGSGSFSGKKESAHSTSSDELFSDDFCFGGNSSSAFPSSNPSSMTVEDVVKECEGDASSLGFLTPHTSGKILCALTLLVDKFFDDASNLLNLGALVSFLKELCNASQRQLFSRTNVRTPNKGILGWTRFKRHPTQCGFGDADTLDETLLLQRLGEVMLKVVRSGRPLIHIMKVWAVAGPHFLEAACHKDGSVSKKAICCIHDVVNALLGFQTELAHFHFNEALFKPFENLLCLELCDIEVQDQIVSSICEFVESCNIEIKSGWRPLFGALRCVRVMPLVLPSQYSPKGSSEDAREVVGHLRAVKDVFEAFLSTDNVLVFSNAALDCILCLLKHVKGPGEGERVTETLVCWGELVGGDMCLDALRYIHRCAVILASMYMMPIKPVFHAARRIYVTNSRNLVDCNIPGIDETKFWDLIHQTIDCKENKVPYHCLWPNASDNEPLCLQEMDQGSGLLQVWYVLLEGLAGAVITSHRRHQPQILDTLFSLMRALPECPGPTFGLYCVNHLLLPLMQEWLRRSYSAQTPDWECAQSFKQYAGLTSDLVVEYLKRFANDDIEERKNWCRLMLKQCMIVLVECVSCPSELISRLGCSCIRHVALSCGDKFDSSLWDVIVYSLHRASQVCLFPLYQVMQMFCPDSPNFYGDIGQVKVAARRDCTGRDTDRLRQISHQVFLLECQRSEVTSVEDNPDAEDRSFIFLLYGESSSVTRGLPKKGEEEEEPTPVRVPFRSIVVGLLANQMILQTMGQLLVEGSPHVVPSLANVLLQATDFGHSTDGGVPEIRGQLPGMLRYLSTNQVKILLNSLRLSYEASVQFDRRPGLKFLIQKVAQSERAANLYKQAGACWTLRMLTLFDLVLSRVKHGLDLSQVKSVLDSETKRTNTIRNPEISSAVAADKPRKPTSLLDEDTQNYIECLRETFDELCGSYLTLVAVSGTPSVADSVDDKPIFFLTIPADEFPTSHRRSLERWSRSLEHFNRDYIKGSKIVGTREKERSRQASEIESKEKDSHFEIEETGSDSPEQFPSSFLPAKMTLGVGAAAYRNEEELCPEEVFSSESQKPFTFADLAQALNSDGEDDVASNCTKEGDSGVASATGGDQTIYSIATERDISCMMSDYRRRKNQHALPSQFPGRRTNPFLDAPGQQSFRPSESVTPEIEMQRSNSLMKDSEAHLKVWTEMVVTVFDLISQMSENELRPLLPVVFPTMRSLTAHAHDPHLRQVVAELLSRVACLYGFSPAE